MNLSISIKTPKFTLLVETGINNYYELCFVMHWKMADYSFKTVIKYRTVSTGPLNQVYYYIILCKYFCVYYYLFFITLTALRLNIQLFILIFYILTLFNLILLVRIFVQRKYTSKYYLKTGYSMFEECVNYLLNNACIRICT